MDITLDFFKDKVYRKLKNTINIQGFTEKDQKKIFYILAEKNLKKNFGIGLIQFIDYLKNLALS